MKSNIIRTLAVALFCVFVFQNVEAQRFIGSAIAGVNFAQIEGDGVHGFYKVGFNGGLGLTMPLNPKQTWQLSLELLYTQKGSVKRCQPGYFDTLVYAPSMYTDVKPFSTSEVLSTVAPSSNTFKLPTLTPTIFLAKILLNPLFGTLL